MMCSALAAGALACLSQLPDSDNVTVLDSDYELDRQIQVGAGAKACCLSGPLMDRPDSEFRMIGQAIPLGTAAPGVEFRMIGPAIPPSPRPGPRVGLGGRPAHLSHC